MSLRPSFSSLGDESLSCAGCSPSHPFLATSCPALNAFLNGDDPGFRF